LISTEFSRLFVAIYPLFRACTVLFAITWRCLCTCKAPLQLSRKLYKSAFLCKTNPILPVFWPKNAILPKNKPNSNPIQSQFAGVLKMKVSSALTGFYGDMATLTARQNKPKQTQFRHLLRSGRVLFDDAASAARWVDERLRLLWQGRTKKLPDALERLRKRYRSHKREAVDGLHRYILSNEEQMHLKNPPAMMNHTRSAEKTKKTLQDRQTL